MPVLIKGMEMPKSCDKCELMTANYGCAFVGAVGGESYRKRAWDCPLIEVPTPHGRLIDADEFIKGHCNLCDGACENTYCDCLSCKETMRCDMIQDFSNAPTIIESEEAFDNGACFNGKPSEKVKEEE